MPLLHCLELSGSAFSVAYEDDDADNHSDDGE
jgi:hypothetical protein